MCEIIKRNFSITEKDKNILRFMLKLLSIYKGHVRVRNCYNLLQYNIYTLRRVCYLVGEDLFHYVASRSRAELVKGHLASNSHPTDPFIHKIISI